jgi:predicted DNA binding CopG/RHH family protein
MQDNLSNQEQEILTSFEKNQLVRVKNAKQKIILAKNASATHLIKDQRINIRLSSFDLDRIKRISVNEGLPYQTLIASILHKYADANLTENNRDLLN